jgi:hypothetical protein
MATYVKTCSNYATFCHAIIIVFSVDKKRTYFNAINKWLALIQKSRLPCNVFLVANKCDVNKKERMVTTEEATIVARARGLHYIEVSAANGRNSEDLITSLTNVLFRRIVEKENYESKWPDLLVAQNSRRINALRFFHTVVQIPERKPVKLSQYNGILTDDAEVSDDEDDVQCFSEHQMREYNTALDEKESAIPWNTFIHLENFVGKWPGADNEVLDSENYVEADEESHMSAPPSINEDEHEEDVEEEQDPDHEDVENEGMGGGGMGGWGGTMAFGKMPIYRDYVPSDDEEEDTDSSEEAAEPEENNNGRDAFADTKEYHPTLNLNSVVREDRGVRTVAITKTFKKANTSSHSLTDQVVDDTKSDTTELVNREQSEQDIQKREAKRQSMAMNTGMKNLGSGLVDDLIEKALEKENNSQTAESATTGTTTENASSKQKNKKKGKEECSVQ